MTCIQNQNTMSTKSVACTIFLIICFSSYTLGKPYDNREKESRPVIAAQDEPCGMMCKAGKAKGKVMNRTKSAVDGVRSKIKGVKDTVIDVLGFGDDGKRDVGSKPVLYVQPGIVYDFEPYPFVKEIDDETTTTTTIAKHSDNDTDIYTHIYVQDNSGESRHENDNTNNALSKSAESKPSIDKDKQQPTNKQNAFDENIDKAESVVDDKGKSSLGGGGGELLNKVEGLNNNDDGIPINTDKLLFESEKKIFVDKTESSLTTALRTGFDDKVESASDAANDNLTKNKAESTLDNGKSDLKVDKNDIVVEKNKSDLKIELDKAESALNNKSDDVRRSDKEVKSSKSNLTAELDKTKFSLDTDKSDSKVALNETKSTLDAGEEDLLKAGLDKVSATTLDLGKVDPKIGSDTISTTDKAESASEGKGESELNFELAENRFNNNLDDDKEKPIETATNTSMAIITNVVTAKSEASIAAAEDKSVSKAELGKSNSSLSIDNDSTSKPLETIANFDFGKKESATIIDQATSSNSSDRSNKTESNLNANNHTDIIKNDALSKAIQNINDGKSNESLTTAIPTTLSGNSNISSIGAVDTMTSKSNSSYSDESESSGNENKPKSSLLELVKNQASAVSSEGAKESERLADMAKAGKSELGSLLKKTESGIGGLFGNKNKIF